MADLYLDWAAIGFTAALLFVLSIAWVQRRTIVGHEREIDALVAAMRKVRDEGAKWRSIAAAQTKRAEACAGGLVDLMAWACQHDEPIPVDAIVAKGQQLLGEQ